MLENMTESQVSRFACPNCNASYKVVRVEADSATTYNEISCARCGGPLNGREGRYLLKYFLVEGRGGFKRSSKPPVAQLSP